MAEFHSIILSLFLPIDMWLSFVFDSTVRCIVVDSCGLTCCLLHTPPSSTTTINYQHQPPHYHVEHQEYTTSTLRPLQASAWGWPSASPCCPYHSGPSLTGHWSNPWPLSHHYLDGRSTSKCHPFNIA